MIEDSIKKCIRQLSDKDMSSLISNPGKASEVIKPNVSLWDGRQGGKNKDSFLLLNKISTFKSSFNREIILLSHEGYLNSLLENCREFFFSERLLVDLFHLVSGWDTQGRGIDICKTIQFLFLFFYNIVFLFWFLTLEPCVLWNVSVPSLYFWTNFLSFNRCVLGPFYLTP